MIISRIGLKRNENEGSIRWSIRSGFYLIDFFSPSDKAAKSTIWSSDNEQTSVQYVEEQLINIRYLIIKGKDREKIFTHMCNSLDIITYDEIKQIVQNESYFAENSEEYIEAIYHLGIIAIPGNYDDELFALFEKVLSHSNAEVRNAGIIAIHFAGWRQFKEPLEQMHATPIKNLYKLG